MEAKFKLKMNCPELRTTDSPLVVGQAPPAAPASAPSPVGQVSQHGGSPPPAGAEPDDELLDELECEDDELSEEEELSDEDELCEDEELCDEEELGDEEELSEDELREGELDEDELDEDELEDDELDDEEELDEEDGDELDEDMSELPSIKRNSATTSPKLPASPSTALRQQKGRQPERSGSRSVRRLYGDHETLQEIFF